MLIEHFVVGDGKGILDARAILANEIEAMKEFQVRYGTKILKFPNKDLVIDLTVTTEGAIVKVIGKSQNISFTNVFCFEKKHGDNLIKRVNEFCTELQPGSISTPRLEKCIYTIPIIPLKFSKEQRKLVDVIVMYIFHALYLARM